MPAFGLDLRKHALTPQEWANGAFTDFWILGAINGMLTAGNAHELSDYGWTTTALTLQSGSGSDFISSADDAAGRILLGDAGDVLSSPVIFGNYSHARMVQALLGYLPTKLIMEASVIWTVSSNNETATGFGFFEDGGAPNVANDHLAMITSNGTNFVLRSGAASDAGAAVDTSAHIWRIEITSTAVEWFIDGTSQGTIALEADEFPVGWGGGVLATTGANFFGIHWAHVYYE